MMKIFLALALAGGTAAASPNTEASKEVAPTATCKKIVVGRGLDRKVICAIEAPVVVKETAAKPKVVIVTRDARHVVGRPKSSDRLEGLSHRRN